MSKKNKNGGLDRYGKV